jgi:hypothetical protein
VENLAAQHPERLLSARSLESEKKAWQEIFPSGGCGLGCLLLYASISAATAITCASSQITHHFQLYYYFNSQVNEPAAAAAECFSALALGSRSVYFAGALRAAQREKASNAKSPNKRELKIVCWNAVFKGRGHGLLGDAGKNAGPFVSG